MIKRASTAAAVVLACGFAAGNSAAANPVWIEWQVSQGGNGHLYAITTDNPMTWTAAKAQAVDVGGHLVTVNDGDENQFVLDTFGALQEYQIGRLWIGFTDQIIEGHWEWIGEIENPEQHWDGGWWESDNPGSTSYTNWDAGEPNNLPDEDYGAMYTEWEVPRPPGTWVDLRDDDHLYHGIIEIPEPGTLSLMILGGLLVTRRRR